MADLNRRPSVPFEMPPPLEAPSVPRRGSEVSPSRSSFQSSNGPSRIHTPSTSVPNTPIIPTRPPSPEKRPLHPAESNIFLTALAAQERRVFELKEELQKAEIDLEKLKKQWAAHEAIKKRNEARHTEQLQPLKTNPPEQATNREEGSAQANRELDRRKTLSSSTRSSQRKVFEGSRHTRTLSLLSTKNSGSDTQFPPRGDSLGSKSKGKSDSVGVPQSIPELEAPQESSKAMKEPLKSPERELFKSPDREMIIETGKQLVGDFRQGFWTFVEDLKQVTVGDETSPVHDARNSLAGNTHGSRGGVVKGRVTANKESPADSDIGQEKTRGKSGGAGKTGQQGKQSNESCATKSEETTSNHAKQRAEDASDSDEGWDSWDTPKADPSTSETTNGSRISGVTASPMTDQSSPRTSVSSSDTTLKPKNVVVPTHSQHAIPWPTLSQLSPSKLTKTASNMVREWEERPSPAPSEAGPSSVSVPVPSKEKKTD